MLGVDGFVPNGGEHRLRTGNQAERLTGWSLDSFRELECDGFVTGHKCSDKLGGHSTEQHALGGRRSGLSGERISLDDVLFTGLCRHKLMLASGEGPGNNEAVGGGMGCDWHG